MIIKEEDEAQEVVSGVFVIENKNWEYTFNWDLALWLNAWITDWSIQWVNSKLTENNLILEQNKYITLDNKNWWIKISYKNLRLNLEQKDIQKIKKLILTNIWEIKSNQKIQIEFSIIDFKNKKQFKLLQKNYINDSM
jgi:hypothetical protein